MQNLCRRTANEEKEEREQRYTDLCRSVGKEPEPFSPPLAPENEPSLTVAEDLERALRRAADVTRIRSRSHLKQAIADFVAAVLAQQQ